LIFRLDRKTNLKFNNLISLQDMTIKNRQLFLTVLICGVLFGCSKKSEYATTDSSTTSMTPPADTSHVTAPPTPPPAPELTDANILGIIDGINTMEIDAGKIAQAKGKSAEVKSFAKMMVTDHSKMKKEGEALAKKDSLTPELPANDTSKQHADNVKSALDAKTGSSFDSTYITEMVNGHQQALNMLTDFQGKAKNENLKSMIAAAIPKVQAHLDKAKAIWEKLSGTTATAEKKN
jgi:putative membrane protein